MKVSLSIAARAYAHNLPVSFATGEVIINGSCCSVRAARRKLLRCMKYFSCKQLYV